MLDGFDVRLRIFSVAGRLSRSGRTVRLRLAEHLLWDAQITAAVMCMQAIQPGASPSRRGSRAARHRQHKNQPSRTL
jgi:hypothetical protein